MKSRRLAACILSACLTLLSLGHFQTFSISARQAELTEAPYSVSTLEELENALEEQKKAIEIDGSIELGDTSLEIDYPLELTGGTDGALTRNLASSYQEQASILFKTGAQGSAVQNLTLICNSKYETPMIEAEPALTGLTIENCSFETNRNSLGPAVALDVSNSDIVIDACVFNGSFYRSVKINGEETPGKPESDEFNPKIIVQNSQFYSNSLCVSVSQAADVLIQNNTFNDYGEDTGISSTIELYEAVNVKITQNQFLGSNPAFSCVKSSGIMLSKNIFGSAQTILDLAKLEFTGSTSLNIESNIFQENNPIEFYPFDDEESNSNISFKKNSMTGMRIGLITFGNTSPEDSIPVIDPENGMDLNENYWGEVPSLSSILEGNLSDQYVDGDGIELSSWYEQPPVETAENETGPIVVPVEGAILNDQVSLVESQHGSYVLNWEENQNLTATRTVSVPTDAKLEIIASPEPDYLFTGLEITKLVPDLPGQGDLPEPEIDENIAVFDKPEYAISVEANFAPVLADLSLEPSSIQMYTGATAAIDPILTPADAYAKLEWSSSDESIASVDQNGQVSAIAPGTATITASAQDLSAACQITVVNPPAPSRPTPTPTPEPTPGPDNPTDKPSDQPVTEEDSPDFESDSGINSGVSGTGPGFTENGSTTAVNPETNEQITYTQNDNGTKAATTQSASGEITQAVITIPASSIDDGIVYPLLGENDGQELSIPGNKTVESNAPEIILNLAPSAGQTRVVLSIEPGTLDPGTVAMLWNGEIYAPVPATVFDEENNTLSFPVNGSARVVILNNAITFADENLVPAYARQAAAFTSARGLMTGMGESLPKPFDFNANTSRGQFATILYRLENKPEVSGPYPAGIIEGAWNADAARWAKEKGLMAQGNSLFDAEKDITRDQIIAILWRNQGRPQVSLSYLEPYQDADEISSDEFKQAMAWGVKEKLIGQDAQRKLFPTDFASRAEIAAIFQRAIEALY